MHGECMGCLLLCTCWGPSLYRTPMTSTTRVGDVTPQTLELGEHRGLNPPETHKSGVAESRLAVCTDDRPNPCSVTLNPTMSLSDPTFGLRVSMVEGTVDAQMQCPKHKIMSAYAMVSTVWAA